MNSSEASEEENYKINLTSGFFVHCTRHTGTRGLYLIPIVMFFKALIWKAKVRNFCDEHQQKIPNIAGEGVALSDKEEVQPQIKC